MSSFEDALNKWNTPIKKSEDNIDNLGNIEEDPEYQKALKSWNNTPDVPKSKTPVITPMATRVPLPITMPISTPPVITADNQGIPSWGSVAGKSLAAALPDAAGSMVNAAIRMPIKGINIGLNKLGLDTDPEDGLAGVAGKFVEGQEKLVQKTMEGLENMTPAQEFVSAGLRAVPNVLTAAFMGAGTGGLVRGLGVAGKAGAMLPAAKTGTSAAVQLARMAPFGTGAAGSYAREAELEGASFTEQLLYGTASGLAEMGTELPVVEGVLKFANRIKNNPVVEQGAKNLLQHYGKLGVDWFKNIAKETVQEAIIEPITGTAKKVTYQPDMPLYGEGGVVDPAAMWESGKAGASMSLILTALGLPATSMAHVRVTKAIEENRPLDQNEIDQVAKDIQGDIQQPVSAQQPTKGEILPKVDVEAWNAAGQTMQTGQTKQIDTQKATLESGSNAKLISDGREILPTTREKEGAKAIAPETTPTTSDEAILEPADKSILPGQKHTLKTYGEVEIVNTDDPKKIIIRNQKGKEVSIARDRFERLRQEEAEAQKSDVIDLPEETDDIRIINGEVFYKDNGATTAKRGYAWFTNRESRFGNKRKSIVLPDRKQQKGQAPPVDTSTQAPYNDINTIENQKAGAKNVPGIQVRNQTSDEETLSKIEQQVRQRAAGTIPEGTRVYEPVADETKGTKKNKDVQAAREIAKLFGHRFVYFRTNPELKKISKELYETANNFNGANVDGTIVINADRTNPAHAVTGHEIVHEIAKDKEIYEDFINIIKGLTTEEGHAAVKELIDAYNEAGITISEERAWEEFAADFVAEQMTKKEFWEKLAERSPSAVQKAINVIKKIISSLRKMVEPGDSVSQFIRDLELAQDIAVDAVAKYLDKTTQKKAEGVLSEADKKFLDGITKSGTTLATVIENTRDDINKKIETVVGWLKAEIAEGKPGKRIMIDDPQADFSYDPKWYSIPSTHAKWYRDFWAEHNRKPSNRDLKEIAEDWLRNGVDAKETYMSAGEDIPPDTEFLELEAFLSELQRIDEAITRGYEEAELAGTQDVRGNQEDIGTGADIRFSAKNKEIGYKESGQLLSVEEQLSFSFNTQVKKTLDQLEFNFPEIKGKEATRDAAKAIVEIQQQQKEGSDLSDQRGEVDRDRKHSGSRIKTVARDYARKLLNKGRISFVGKRIKSPEELAIMAQVLRDPRFETFRIFFTRTLQDGSKEIVWHTGVTSKIPGTARVSVGDTAQERADWINNTFRQGAFHNADGYFFMHNHPTGDPKPSKQDLNVSEHFFRSIKGLNFEGHIIINSNRYSFISPDDVIAKKYGIFILPNITKDALLTPDKPHPLLGKIPVDASGHATSASMAALVYQHKAPKGFSVLFYFSPQLKVRGIQEVPSINFSDEKKFKSWLRDQAIEFGGQNVVLVAENDDVFNYAKTLIKDNYFLDVINMSGGRSAQEMGFTPSGEDIWMGKKEKGIETWEERMKYLVAGQPLFQLKVKGGRWTKAKEQGTQKQQPTNRYQQISNKMFKNNESEYLKFRESTAFAVGKKYSRTEDKEEVISSNTNMGIIFRVGDKVYKPTVNKQGKKTMEAEVYEALKDVPGIAPGKVVVRNDIEYIETPFYKTIISIDTVQKKDRGKYANIVYENSQLINSAISALTNAGFSYADPLQFGVNDKEQMELMDFSNASRGAEGPGVNLLEDNFALLRIFYQQFGAEKLGEIVSTGIRLKGTAKLYSSADLKKGRTLLGKEEQETLRQIKQVGDIQPNNVYYTTNARFVQLKRTVAQTESIDGVKYIFSETPLTEKEIDEWELKKIYESNQSNTPDIQKVAKKEKFNDPDPFAGHTPESEKVGFLPRGFNVTLPGIAKPKRTSFDRHTFENEKIEKEYRSSYGVKKPGIIQQAKEGITESWRGLTRTFKNLDPKNPKFAIAIKELVRYPQLKQKAGDKASRMLDAFLHELGPERYNIFRRKVLLDDLAEEVKLGHELPGEWTPEEVEKELARIEPKIDGFVQKALDKRKAGLRQVVDEYIAAAKEIGFDPSGKFNRENYYRHQVLDYMEVNQRMVPGTGAKVKAKTNYGWQKQRTGKSRKSINTDYLQAEYEVLSQMIYETEKDKMLRRLDKEYSIYDKLVQEAKQKNEAAFQEILKKDPAVKKKWDLQKWDSPVKQQKFIKETLGDKFLTWEDVIPDGYVAWQPRDGRAFYRAQALPEQMVEELLSGALQEIGVALEDIKTVLAVGKEFKHYVLPVELAETLDNIQPMQPQNPFTRSTKFLLSQWKGWTLTGNPRSVVKYNFRNLSGDFDGVIAAAGLKPTKPSFVQKRARELWDAMKNGRFTPDMKEWWEQGGMGSLLYAQEITDINKIPQFKNLMDDSSLRSKIFSLPKNYLEFTRNMTNYREGILRYTMYVYYKQHLKENGGLPKFYGASIPAQIKGLKTIPDRAYQLSKDALGSYDEVTEAGRWIRQHVIPFWSWNEVNFKRYKRLLANALSNEDLQKNTGQAMAKTLGIAGALSAKSLMTLGRITLQVTALSVLITLWNNFFFPDEEDDLPEDVRTKPHIIFGRNDKGEVIYFSRLGALNDFLDWFGLDNLQNDVQDLRTSRKDLKEQISDMAWAPLNKFINGLSPFLKTPLELISGSTYYPDARTPRRIRDKGEYAASTVGLTEEYKRLAGKPAKEKYAASWQNALYYRAKPDESAYYYALDLKRKFEEKVQGKRPSESYNDSPKSKALYYFKQSLKYGDQEKAYKYIVDYFENGGTAQGVNLSLQTMNPLYGLSAKPEKGQTVSEQIEFHNWLNERDRDKVRKALKYYNETVQFNPKNQSEKQIYTTIERMILATRKNEERRKKLMMPIIKAMVKQAN